MPVIRVEMFSGKSREQKRKLAQQVTNTFVEVTGVKPEHVTVLFSEMEMEDWAVAGKLVADQT